ncbi:hypothetical protein [Nocardioides sp. T2.26MG-1]|uniref:hypothetical protein n=1 Tax=Nocardioides sp. T2.26MG-1 TaxID=3041166 RepID=UPI0025413E06|nr:hypothetical protein [Nocardioides sp. T2.26MG-1]
MQHDPSFGPAGGIQRLFWLVPAAFLLGVSDSDALPAACAAVLVGVAWQGVYRRPLTRRLTALLTAAGAGALLTRLGPGHWPTEVGSLVAVAAMAATLAVTERALGALDTLRAARSDETVPAGT